MNLDRVLEALGDPMRRDLFERLVVRPSRVRDLAATSPLTRSAVSYHLRLLREAGLIREGDDGRLYPARDLLPQLRAYFDRLWLEATLGDGWLLQRRQDIADLGL